MCFEKAFKAAKKEIKKTLFEKINVEDINEEASVNEFIARLSVILPMHDSQKSSNNTALIKGFKKVELIKGMVLTGGAILFDRRFNEFVIVTDIRINYHSKIIAISNNKRVEKLMENIINSKSDNEDIRIIQDIFSANYNDNFSYNIGSKAVSYLNMLLLIKYSSSSRDYYISNENREKLENIYRNISIYTVNTLTIQRRYRNGEISIDEAAESVTLLFARDFYEKTLKAKIGAFQEFVNTPPSVVKNVYNIFFNVIKPQVLELSSR